jgi:ribose transport system permease protein
MHSSAGSATNNQPQTTNKFVARILSEYSVLLLTFILLICVAPFASSLISGATALNIASALLPLFIAAIGLTVVMITGGIDLSIPAVISFASVAGAKLMTGQHTLSAIVFGASLMLGIGAAIGALNGILITLLRLPAFIVTLASTLFFNGFAVWFTQSKNISNLPDDFLAIGQKLPLCLTITLLLALLIHFALGQTLFGRWLYATGQNATAAYISGVPVRVVTFCAYVFSGICAALASVFLTGRLETGSPVLGREMLLDVVGATVIGGTSLFGGRGQVSWTFFGVLFLTLLDTALNLMNLSQFAITISKGSVILLAAVLDSTRRRLMGSA